MEWQTVRDVVSVGGFVLAAGAIITGWIAWRALITNHVEDLKTKFSDVQKSVSDVKTAQATFERHVSDNFVSKKEIESIQTSIDRGFDVIATQVSTMATRIDAQIHAVTARIDALFAREKQ